jgi:predicted alternative tryptophan synthase beta-subunit
MLHQTIIGLEAKKQLAMGYKETGYYHRLLWGRSNFAGLSFRLWPIN